MPRRASVLVAVLLLAGCGDPAPAGLATTPSSAAGIAPAPSSAAGVAAATGFNDTDVMFLQMSLEHARQASPVAELAAERGTSAEVRRLGAAMGTEWATETTTMTRWLTGWDRPLAADPESGVHAGHGDLHSLRESDIAELRAASGADFDRTALSLLLGHLHNSVEVTRLEAAGGAYPPAKDLAATMTTTRMTQIQTMLGLVA